MLVGKVGCRWVQMDAGGFGWVRVNADELVCVSVGACVYVC